MPPSDSIVTVKAFNNVKPSPSNKAPASVVVFPVIPGRENLEVDSLAFLVENPRKNVKVMFDIGIRKDVENLAPSVVQLFTSGAFHLETEDSHPQKQRVHPS